MSYHMAPPMRLAKPSWFGQRDMTLPEAEAYHLREAAKLAGAMTEGQMQKQSFHLNEAARNRHWYQQNQKPLSAHIG